MGEIECGDGVFGLGNVGEVFRGDVRSGGVVSGEDWVPMLCCGVVGFVVGGIGGRD